MKWTKYQIHTMTAAVDPISGLLYELGIPGFEITDNIPLTPEEEQQMFTDIPAALAPDDGSALITFYTEAENAEEDRAFYSTGSSLRDEELPQTQWNDRELLALLQERLEQLGEQFSFPAPVITISTEDDSLWKDKWKENFQTFRIAEDIIIKPVWEKAPEDASPQDIILEINPGSAFGTGAHETTQLCLRSLRKYISDTTTILDAGCGSGILAISALLCGAHSALCLDIDPTAVDSTMENAGLNQLQPPRIQAARLDILKEGSRLKALHPEPFSVIVANILADVIVLLSDHIGEFLEPGGIFISSGILAEKAGTVEEALRRNHFTILERNTLGDWISFVAIQSCAD